jgi:hypothetical protein
MTEHNDGNVASSDYQPDFELPHYGAVREDNWEEYKAKGFSVLWSGLKEETGLLPNLLRSAEIEHGVENVFTGDAYDYDAERPLHHKPGIAIYVSPEGRKRAEQWWAEHRRKMAEHGYHTPPDSGPAAS